MDPTEYNKEAADFILFRMNETRPYRLQAIKEATALFDIPLVNENAENELIASENSEIHPSETPEIKPVHPKVLALQKQIESE